MDTQNSFEERRCPQCGRFVKGSGRGRGKVFCAACCRTRFNNRSKAEGAVMVALVKCWHENRHAKSGTREAELCRRARTELSEITRTLLERDAEAGRPPIADYVEVLLDGTLYADRSRK